MRFSMKDFAELSSSSSSSEVSMDVNGNIISEKKTEISESRSNQEPENEVEEYRAPKIEVNINDPIYGRSNHESETFDSLNRDWNSELNAASKQAKNSADLEKVISMDSSYKSAEGYDSKSIKESKFKNEQLRNSDRLKINRRGKDMSVINRILKFRNFSEEEEKKEEVLTEEVKDTKEVKPEVEDVKEDKVEEVKPEEIVSPETPENNVIEAPTKESVEEQISEPTSEQPILSQGWATGAQEDMLADSGVTVINPANEGYEDRFDELAQIPEYPIEDPVEIVRPESSEDDDELDEFLTI